MAVMVLSTTGVARADEQASTSTNPCELLSYAICEWMPDAVGSLEPGAQETDSTDSESLPVICPMFGFCYSPVDEIDCDFYYDSPMSVITGTRMDTRWEWGSYLQPLTQTFIGSPDGRFYHDVYSSGILNHLSWDYGSVHEIGYWYHGSIDNGRFSTNQTLHWNGKVEHIYDVQRNWQARFECKA